MHESLLSPLSREDVAHVLDNLQLRLGHNPDLARDPAFLGLIRLTLTASHGAGEEGETSAVDPLAEMDAEHAQVEAAREAQYDREREARRRVRDAAPTPPPAAESYAAIEPLSEENAKIEMLQRAVETLQADLTQEKARAQQLTEALAALQAEHEQMRGQLKRLKKERDESQRKHQEAASSWEPERQRLLATIEEQKGHVLAEVQKAVAKTEERLFEAGKGKQEAARREVRQAVLKVLKEVEYSGASSRYKDQNTGKPVACCPACGGLTTKEHYKQDKDFGHHKSCWLDSLMKEMTK